MIHTQNEGIYRALIAQLDKLARHNRQESYKTGSVITRPCSASAASWRRNTAYRS